MTIKQKFAIVLLAFTALLILSAVPKVSAYGSGENWQIGASGTGTLCIPNGGCGGFGFWGWCAFYGVSSGTVGDCQFSQYLHSGTVLGTAQCETSFDVTRWHTAAGVYPSLTDFFIDTGSVRVNPASATATCISLLQGAGFNVVQTGANIGTFSPTSDTEIPSVPGHYNFNGLVAGPITYTELQFQVSER
ncbi:MAG TPA: hypothetical protein VFF30_01085 [Nitrososphaerales archaeon]|nr:hypothetical protein [Nitrososphaerales archaeon]